MLGSAVIAVVALVPPEPPDIASPRAAEFRQVAREVYTSALRESCPPVNTLPRSAVLADQRRALAAFERQHELSPIGVQLQIAREDAKLDLGCWADGDPAFAKLHVLLARTNVTKGLAKLDQLAPEIGGGRGPAQAQSRASALFRKQVRAAVAATDPECDVSALADNDTVLAAAQQELGTFREEIEGTARALDFDAAQSDQVYQTSLALDQCPAPSARPVAELGAEAVAATRKRIAELRKAL
jgi:hypothetical protein